MDTFESWSTQVVASLRKDEGADLFQESIELVQQEQGPAPELAWELLPWLRGDEPREAFEGGDSPKDYADFLLAEWDLYGPEGE